MMNRSCIDDERQGRESVIGLESRSKDSSALFEQISSNLSARSGTSGTADRQFWSRSTDSENVIEGFLNTQSLA
jgi:hypothetical protein